MSTNGIIITIDGPAGSGKSTVAKKLADVLRMEYLDTGGMYRATALLGLRHGVDWNNPDELTKLVRQHRIDGREGRTLLDAEDVTGVIRSSEVTAHTHYSADNPDIRKIMVDLQREIAKGRAIVTEGRDQGSAVFPDAHCKFYLTASPEERATRRVQELSQRGEQVDFNRILADINERDRRDSQRAVGPLVQPEDAILIDSSKMNPDQVVMSMVTEARRRIIGL